MSYGSESTDFEWLEPALVLPVSGQEKECSSHFLKEGYLHVMEKIPKASKSTENGSSQLGRAINLVRRFSDSALPVSIALYFDL